MTIASCAKKDNYRTKTRKYYEVDNFLGLLKINIIYQRYWGGLAFCGVSSTPEIFIFIAFLGHFFGLWGFIKAKIFRKFSNKVRKFSKNRQFFEKKANFCPFLPQNAVFGVKNTVFFKISAPSAPKCGVSSAAFGGRSVESGPPLGPRPPQIPPMKIENRIE